MQVLRASVLLAFIMLWQPPLKIKHSPTMPEENREESKWETGSLTWGTSPGIGVWLSSWKFLRKKNKPWSIKGIMWGILYDYLSKILNICMLGNAMEMMITATCFFFFFVWVILNHLLRSGWEVNSSTNNLLGKETLRSNWSRIPRCSVKLYTKYLAEQPLNQSLWQRCLFDLNDWRWKSIITFSIK